ncbi:MAG: nucleotidyl transferase AbiEii/AbiGii toxin family protein [Candidatus Micrarchaeia archaeon]
MLSKDELNEYIEKTGMQNLWQVERDYLQHIILRAIYSKVSKGLVFKGGTALQKLNIIDRFSIDLDFTSSLSNEEISNIMVYVSDVLNDLGIRNKYNYYNDNKHKESFNVNFEIEGPYFVATRSEKAKVAIKLQISKREEVLLGQKAESITPIYKDISPYVVAVMNMEEVAAEKVRAIMTRNKPRDVYDLYILIKKGYNLHEFIVRKKLASYVNFSLKDFEKAIDKKRDPWNIELKNLLYKQRIDRGFPKFEDCKATILDFFKNNISLTAEFDTTKQGVLKDNGKKVSTYILLSLNDAKKIRAHIYPPFNAKIIAFFYFKPSHIHLEIYENGKLLVELPDSINFPQSNESIDAKINVKKGSDIYFQLFIEKSAINIGKVYAAILLKKR